MSIVPDSLVIEVCIDSVESAITAAKAGADRLEVCSNLGAGGGTTATLGLVKSIQKAVDLPLMVMIRPRVGDFLYSTNELGVMVEDIRAFKEAGGVRGFVVGALTKDGRVDIESMKVLVDEILPLEVCFHRAFDMTQDPIEAMADITNIGGISRILTSGQSRSAPQGLAILKKIFEERTMFVEDVWGLTVMPGSGINEKTLPPLLEALLPVGLREIHLSGGKWIMGDMAFKRDDIGMGIGHDTEWGVWRTQEGQVRKVRDLCDKLWTEYVATVAK